MGGVAVGVGSGSGTVGVDGGRLTCWFENDLGLGLHGIRNLALIWVHNTRGRSWQQGAMARVREETRCILFLDS